MFTNNVSFCARRPAATSDKHVGTDVANSNCWWDKSKSQPSINGKGLSVTAADFAASLANPTVTRNADGSIVLTIFRLAAGSDLINAGAVPAGTLPFDAAGYYRGPRISARSRRSRARRAVPAPRRTPKGRTSKCEAPCRAPERKPPDFHGVRRAARADGDRPRLWRFR